MDSISQLINRPQRQAVLWAGLLLLLVSGCGGSSGGDGFNDARREARELTRKEKDELTQVALSDPIILRLTGGQRPQKRYLLRWTNEDASELLGAGVYVAFQPAVSLRDQRLPFYLTPVEGAPPNTPNQRRTRVISATGVTEFKVRVLLDGHKVAEVEPLGPEMNEQSARILGPPVEAAYLPAGD